MLNLPSKALLYRDWKYSKWFMLLIFFELFVVYIKGFLEYNQVMGPRIVTFYSSGRYLAGILLLVITIAFMSAVLFTYERKRSVYTLTASMPFKRKEIVVSKWFVGVYNIFVPHFCIYVIMNALLITNFCWKKYFFEVTQWFILYLLMSFCILGFILMAQSLNGSALFGSFLAMLLIIAPFSLLYLWYGLNIHYNSVILTPHYLQGILNSGINESLVKFISIFIGISFDPHSDLSQYLFIQNHFWFWLRCLSFLGLGVLFYILSIKLFQKSKFEKTGYLTTVGAFEKLYKIIMAYITGFLLNYIFSTTITPEYFFRPDTTILFCVIIPVPLYFILGRGIKAYNKRLT